MSAVTAPKNATLSAERRRHPRQRVSSVTYVKLGDGNGGILLNIGTGGLLVQAFAKVNVEQDLVLQFRFFDNDEMLAVTGRTTWLGSTGKAAGIRFNDLSAETEQRIADWISTQQIGSQETQSKVASATNSVEAASKINIPSVQITDLPISSRDDALDTRSRPSKGVSGDPRPRVNVRDLVLSIPETPHVPEISFPSQKLAEAIHSETPAVASTVNAFEVPLELSRPFLRTEPARSYEVFKGSVWGTQTPPVSSPEVISAPTAAAQGTRRRTLIIAGLTACVGIFALILAKGSFGNRLDLTLFRARSALSAISTAPNQVSARIAQRHAALLLLAKIRNMLPGLKDNSLSGPSVLGTSVWMDQRSGFYYCKDSPSFAKVQPGSVATQDEALQRGYQPKLGTYCR
jgi:Tfp pilus assembly protein PilZ